MTYTAKRTSLRRLLISHQMFLALEAMEFAERFHTGRRRDGSHEFSHQIEMAEMLIDVPGLPQLEETLAVCFLHDVREDYDIPDNTLRYRFGGVVADAVALLTKTINTGADNVFRRISCNPIAAVVKGVDRMHNLGTMKGAFSPAKQVEYHGETQSRIRPMLVDARRRHRCRRGALAHILGGLDRLSPPVATLANA